MPDMDKCIELLERAAKPGILGLAIKCSSPVKLRDILSVVLSEMEEIESDALEFYLDPDEPEVLMLVNTNPAEEIMIDLELLDTEVG